MFVPNLQTVSVFFMVFLVMFVSFVLEINPFCFRGKCGGILEA